MRKFIVNSKIVGRRNVVFNPGDVINETDVPHNHLHSLLNRGFLRDVSQYQPPITGKIKLAIVTSVWGRPEVFRMFMKGVEQLVENCCDFQFTLVVSTSFQQDRSRIYDEEIRFEDVYNEWIGNSPCPYVSIEIPNEPLGAKVNATTYACRNLDVHYVLCMGSDDIISPELLNEYAVHMRKGIDLIGVSDFYFYDTVSKQSLYWAGYREVNRKNSSVGAARCLSARLLSELNWSPWDYNSNSRLDHSMSQKIAKVKHSHYIFSMKSKGLFAVDIKSETNISKFKKWDNSEFIDTEILKEQFHYLF